jgi:hypothetical protein
MRAIRLTAAALVLAALSTLGAGTASADESAAANFRAPAASSWQW